MTKNQQTMMTQVAVADGSPCFLFGRQRVVHLMSMTAETNPRFIWRKVFLREKRHL